MKTRSLLVIVCFGLLFNIVHTQLVGLHLENGYYLNAGTNVTKESVVANKLRLNNVCDITKYNENIECEYAGSSKTVAFLYIDCKDLVNAEAVFSLLTECKSSSKLSKGRVSYESCVKAYCNTGEDMALSLLVIQTRNEREFNNAYKLSNLNFRFKRSTREIKLSPTSLHLLLREQFSFSNFVKTNNQWNSPFYGKFVTYYIGSFGNIPTLDFALHKFELSSLNPLISEAKEHRRRASNVILYSENLISISWVLITQMEMYWSRGVLQNGTAMNSNSEYSDVFDSGLSNRVHCSLGPHTFLINLKPYIDSFEYELESETKRNVTDSSAFHIASLFENLGTDIDSFFIIPSQYEITSDDFGKKQDGVKNLMDANFPCMTRYKKHDLKRYNLHEYSYKSIIEFYNKHGKSKVNFPKLFLSKRIIYEDVYSLVYIVDLVISYIDIMLEKFQDLEGTSIKRYFDRYKRLIEGVRDIKNDVKSICGIKAFNEYTSKKNTTKQACSLKYSISIAHKLHKLFYKTMNKFIENDEYKKYYLYSTEDHIRASYCLYRGVHESNHGEIPNEILGRISLHFSMIHNDEDFLSENSIYTYCYNYFNSGSRKEFMDITIVPKICRLFSKCMQRSENISLSIAIYNKLKNIDLVGDFDKKVSLVSNFCDYSRSMFPIKSSDPSIRDCRVYRFFQLIHRSSMLVSEVQRVKFKLNLFSKEGYYYFIQDLSIASYILINDFCTDPDIAEIIQCNIDLSEYGTPVNLRRYNSISLLDGSRILTPLHFKDPDDEKFVALANGVLFSKILDNKNNTSLRLSYFSGLPFPYSLNNPDLSRKECEDKPFKYSYSPEISNPQRVLVMKLSYSSSSVAYVKRDDFNPSTLARNSKIFKEKFSVPDLNGISVPLVPSIVQIEDSKYSGSICNYLLYPYIMLTEFVNPHVTHNNPPENLKLSAPKNKKENTLDYIKYPVGLFSVTDKISRSEPLALNFIVTERGYRFLHKALKAYYMLGYLFTTMLISFWTGGKKYRQHCDLHGENVLLRMPSDWMKYKWEPFLDSIIKNINLNYFSIIDLDYSYESEINVSDVLRDLSNFPDKDPCSHPSVGDGNHQVSLNDYHRVIGYICPLISLKDLFSTVFHAYPSKEKKKEAFAAYSPIMELSDFTFNYCNGIFEEITELVEKEELTFLIGYNHFRDLRRVIWNSLLQLNELEDYEINKYQNKKSESESDHITGIDNHNASNVNITRSILFSDSLHINNETLETPASGNLRALSKEIKLYKGDQKIDFTKKILPGMLPSITDHALYFYCTSISTKKLLNKNYDYKQLLNFLIRNSSLEGYIRHVDLGYSSNNFSVNRSMLDSIEKKYRECIQDVENREILENKLLKLIINNQNMICPRNICTNIKHLDLFESLISVYRYHFDYFISAIYDSGYNIHREERTMDIKVVMVERESNNNALSSKKKILDLDIDHIRSILEMHNFCIRDRHYSSLELSGRSEMYSRIQCKENPEFKKYGIHANGLLIIQITYFDTAAHESIIFPWIYNTNFSIFEPKFNYKETTHGVSVIGQLVSNNKQPEKLKTIYIHKGDKSIYNFNSHTERYSVPPSIISSLSVKREYLFRSSFMSQSKIKSNTFDVFYLNYNELEERYSINLYDWLNNTLTSIEYPNFNEIPKNIKNSIVHAITEVVSVLKNVWIPNHECRYSEIDFPCFPMFCGMSSKNIILNFSKNDTYVKDVKFLFASDMVIVDSYEYLSELDENEDGVGENSESSNESGNKNKSNSTYRLKDKFLELTCGPGNVNANDIITVASTLRTLLSTIESNSKLDISKVFSSRVEDIHYNFSSMNIFELINIIDEICKNLKNLNSM
ncbi:large containing a signal peptide [Cryptosporidium bovis]|uniref:large containing a signal peptide n=1 Tax=Cryptosporidium bovis TaxID=310047 RepID=UPI00351A0D8C|nr:large containing a signal peptide [Cryptosporidium bovis]